MRWEYKPKPEWRTIIRFAWLPVIINLPMAQYVWLEFYKVNQQLIQGYWIDELKATKEYWSKQK